MILKNFIKWCNVIGGKLINPSIDPNQILKHTLIPKTISKLPDIQLIYIDWSDSFYLNTEFKMDIRDENDETNIAFCELKLISYDLINGIGFEIITPSKSYKFNKLLLNITDPNGNSIPNFNISKIDSENALIKIEVKFIVLEDYLNSNPPIVWFANGSSLQGNEFVEIKSVIRPYPGPIDRASNQLVDLRSHDQQEYVVLDYR